jgi:hypothetical protein
MKNLPLFLSCLVLAFSLSFAMAQTPSKPATEEKTKPCLLCVGSGKSKCANCVGGQANCPAPCLKLSDPGWKHMNVSGHPATDLWKSFPTKNGTQSWNQNHVGEIIKVVNGEVVNQGKCPTCGGTTKVKCATCKGTGIVTCTLSDGKKVVPESWSSFDNPKLKSRPTRFTLKDGRVILGRKTMVLGGSVTIKTEKGDETVQASDIVSEENQRTQK